MEQQLRLRILCRKKERRENDAMAAEISRELLQLNFLARKETPGPNLGVR
jgi:hypothetical protein